MRHILLPVLCLFSTCLFSLKSFATDTKNTDDLPEQSINESIFQAQIYRVLNHDTFNAMVVKGIPILGERLAIVSETSPNKVIGFAHVFHFDHSLNIITLKIDFLSGTYLVSLNDSLARINLTDHSDTYIGHNELLVRNSKEKISARYKPLYTQGFAIGETAHVLDRHEILLSLYGGLSFGLSENISVGTILSGLLLNSPNANAKLQVWSSKANEVSIATNVTKIRDSATTAVNLTLYWDSITNSRMTTHTLLTFAIATLEKVEDTVAVKTAGTSSLQTGYEVLLPNWDRILLGPSYNFEVKSVGGYLAYKKIWNHAHLSISLSAVNLREVKFAQTGYLGLFEMYWRF